jgi:phage FluMu protein Com
MPIEFHCPSCGKLLRTPDESAGKKAKCPQCATIVEIPRPAAPTDFGLPASGGGGEFPAFSNPTPPNDNPFAGLPAANPNPYATSASSAASYSQPTPYNTNSPGLPWEIGPRSLKTFWATTKLIFQQPSNAFRQMRPLGGFDSPILYALVGNVLGGVATGIIIGLIQAVIITMAGMAGKGNEVGVAIGMPVVIFAFYVVMFVVFGAMSAALATFVTGGINHLCLMMVGGAKRPYETTARVCAFASGTTSLLNCIPFCGVYFLAPLCFIIYSIIGLSAAHGISGGKAALAVLLPIIVCCGGAILIYVALIGFVVVNLPR